MRIAHITATFPPYWAGTGNVAYHNARLLHDRGHDVTVLTARTSRDARLEFPFEVDYLPPLLRVGNAPLTPALPGRLRGFDLVHLHYPYIFGAELAAAAARLFGIPLVLTYHNDLHAGGVRGALFRLYSALNQRLLLNGGSELVVTSEDYARNSLFAAAVGADADFSVVPNGVDTALFTPDPAARGRLRARYGVPLDAPLALFVGGLDAAHHFKGVDVLLSALERLPGVHGVVVGEGDLRPAYEARARAFGGDRIAFTGKVPLDELIDLYRGATVTVLPSVTQGEAFGMVLVESLACGTPVVASNLPGVRTVVSDGQDGFLTEPGDAAALARRIGELADDRDRAARMGAAGRAKTLRRYDWEIVGDALERVYARVVGA